MMGLYAPLKDLFLWLKKRVAYKDIDPFVLKRPSLDILRRDGLLDEPNEKLVFVRPESISEKTEISKPSHEVFYLYDKKLRTKRKIVCMDRGKIDLVLLKKLESPGLGNK